MMTGVVEVKFEFWSEELQISPFQTFSRDTKLILMDAMAAGDAKETTVPLRMWPKSQQEETVWVSGMSLSLSG